MRCYYNGCGFTVSYNEGDADDFASEWPCSTVSGKGSFAFESNGDLIDCEGTANDGDGADWLAFSDDCQKYGQPRYEKQRIKEQKSA